METLLLDIKKVDGKSGIKSFCSFSRKKKHIDIIYFSTASSSQAILLSAFKKNILKENL